jgi:hypothetical protein
MEQHRRELALLKAKKTFQESLVKERVGSTWIILGNTSSLDECSFRYIFNELLEVLNGLPTRFTPRLTRAKFSVKIPWHNEQDPFLELVESEADIRKLEDDEIAVYVEVLQKFVRDLRALSTDHDEVIRQLGLVLEKYFPKRIFEENDLIRKARERRERKAIG